MTVIKIVPMPGVGTQGAKGDTGATGLSAYQIAVNNGFNGTEQEWLDSLSTITVGATGSFISADGKVITVVDGLITNIN